MDLRRAHVLLFTKLAHLYDSGVPLAGALDIVKAELDEPLQGALGGVIDDIYRGVGFADALERRPECFGPEIVGVIRAGEQRGELGVAANHVAEGLSGRALDPMGPGGKHIDEFLEFAAHGGLVHIEPTPGGGRLRVRGPDGLEDAGSAEIGSIAVGLQRMAGLDDAGEGVFFWKDRVVRVALMATPEGPSGVISVSGVPGDEPAEAAAWRAGPPGLLAVVGPRRSDKDGCLRSILGGFDAVATKRIAVGLPIPEALPAVDLETALAHDPDVLCLARLKTVEEVRVIANALRGGVHVMCGMDATGEEAREWLAGWELGHHLRGVIEVSPAT